MRVVFAGTPPFAARALEAIAAAGHDVALVLTQPDRPAGRGMRLTPSAVSQVAARLGLHVEKPASLKADEALKILRQAAPEVMVVAAYGLILPRGVLEIPARGCINIHASLLPRWRGAAPIHRALLAGDATTGITIMQMDEGLDTGPILLERALAIGPRETTRTLTDALASLGAKAILEALDSYAQLTPRIQDSSRATYATKIAKSEARIDWNADSDAIDRQVRAFDPAPGAETRDGDEVLKIWSAEPTEGRGHPGEVIIAEGDKLIVACGKGALRLSTLQRAGGNRLAVADFLRGKGVSVGTRLG
ncbi:MAG: methionyl-tRNA formyltransferase [Usitatibacter sp.]